MNHCFLFTYGDGLSLIRAFIVFQLMGKPLHAKLVSKPLSFKLMDKPLSFKLVGKPLSFKLVSKPLSFKLVSKPLYHMHVLGYTFIWMYSLRPIYTCMLPYMRNVYNFQNFLLNTVYFLECVRDPCLLLLFR